MNFIIQISIFITILMMVFAIKNDIKDNSIKNVIPAIGCLCGIILSIFTISFNNIAINLLVCVLFFFLLFAIPRIVGITEFMGAGDIKIYMAIILLMGYKFGIYCFIYSIFIGSIFLLILNISRLNEIFKNIFLFFKTNKQAIAKVIDTKKPNIFSPYILLGVIISYIQIYSIKNDWLFEMIIRNFK